MNEDYRIVTFNAVVLFLLYIIGILGNILIITVICLDVHLHTPIYFFLCNLAIVDICYTTVTVPNLLYILLSGVDTMSSTQCLIQMFFFLVVGTGEDTVILVMAYDRYVAICHPLHYHQILNKKICILLLAVIWICAFVNSSLLVNSVLKMFFCSSTTIHQLFCDVKAMIKISCGGTLESWGTFSSLQ
ncbi:olfactory receptor 1C1-like [Pyxicephalus adspersus]|uniref:olfactory receptor 1C1-like n=1 Tax=Pyxicephalus adspersus TaxID=30357 RepID=UPI003B5B6B9C